MYFGYLSGDHKPYLIPTILVMSVHYLIELALQTYIRITYRPPYNQVSVKCVSINGVKIRAERYCHFSITIDTKATIHDTE